MVRRLIWWQKARRSPPFPAESKDPVGLSGISTSFGVLSQIIRQIIYALLTRAPLNERASSFTPFDLHVLGTPPAFVLSQDQTLQFIMKVWILLTQNLYWQNNYSQSLHKLLFGFQRPAPQQNLRCKQTDNILKSISAVNNFFYTPENFFAPPKQSVSQKGLGF